MKKCYPIFLLLLYSLSLRAQVDLPTGGAVLSFPLFNYSDGGRLGCNISLDYTARNGIKVNDIPSNVGLGWELSAGGSIQRTTNMDPDDQVAGTYGGVTYGNGFLYSPYNMMSPLPLKAGWAPLYTQKDITYRPTEPDILADREQDVFTFHFGGRTGSFVVSKAGEISSLDNNLLKIERLEKDMSAEKIITRICGFIITDETGVKYTFKDYESSRIISYENGPHRGDNAGRYYIPPKYAIRDFSVINTWHLSEIRDPFTGKKIVFSYNDYPLQYQIGFEASMTTDSKTEWVIPQLMEFWYSGTRKRLTGISFPDTKTSISLQYSEQEMADLPGERSLSELSVLREGIQISGYQFSYQYFSNLTIRPADYTFPSSELPYARTALVSFQKTGLHKIIGEPPTRFTYYTGAFPRKFSPDHWGFNNGVNKGISLSGELDTYNFIKVLSTDEGYYRRVSTINEARLGMVREVFYPTGGKLFYEYENNTAAFGTGTVLSGGMRVVKTTSYDMVDTSKKTVTEYRYVKADGSSSGWGYEVPQYRDTTTTVFMFPSGGRNYPPSFAYNVSAISIPIIASGVAKKVAFAQIAGGVAYGMFLAVGISIIEKLFGPRTQITEETVSLYRTLSNHPAKANPLPTMYERVEVISGTTADNIGKEIYEFTSPKDFPLQVPVQQLPYSAKPRFVPGIYGLEKRHLEIDKNGKMVSDVINTYKANMSAVTGDDYISMRWKPRTILMSPQVLFDANYNGINNRSINLQSISYAPLKGMAQLLSVTQRSYDSTGQFSQVIRNHTYTSGYGPFLQSSTIYNSSGDTLQEKYYYAKDYNYLLNIPARILQEYNAGHTRISSESWQNKGGVPYLTGASLTDYKPQSSGNVLPEQQLLLQYAAPLAYSRVGGFDSDKINRIPQVLLPQQALSYDNSSKLIQLSSPASSPVAYQWDANREFVVAVVKNAQVTHTEKTGAAAGAPTESYAWANGNEFITKSITLSATGTISLHLTAQYAQSRHCSYALTGPGFSKNGYLSNVTTYGKLTDAWSTKKDYPPSVAFGNLAAGTYTLTLHDFIFFPVGPPDPTTTVLYYVYSEPVRTQSGEFFYDGFEDNSSAALTSPYIGKRYLSGDYKVPFTIPNTRNYKVDYWYLSAGKWSYNAKAYTSGMTLTDGDAIDEVRVYPADADMTTYTYEPGVGVSSESDRNGRVTFYEYDPMGRLAIIRDQYRNILRRICYGYNGQPENCGGSLFSNVQISQTYTRQGCGPGYTPGTYTYTVPAGKYKTDDQISADALARNELFKSGQATANQQAGCSCIGQDKKEIGGRCETGVRVYFIEPVNGGSQCREGYWYRFSDGSYGPKYYGDFVACP